MDRKGLQKMFEDISNNKSVYYQPPSNVRMIYPAIVYSKKDMVKVHASDDVYAKKIAYSVTVIDSDPDGFLSDKISSLRYCTFDRRYVSDGLYHDVYTLYI